MHLEEKIARTALAVLRPGPAAPCIPGLAARPRLLLESGGIPVFPPSPRRGLQI
jgi:hypothetical protein